MGGDPEERVVEMTDRDRARADRGGGDGAAVRAVEAERRQHRLDHARRGEHGRERIALRGLDDGGGEKGHEQAKTRIEDALGQKLGHAGLVEHPRQSARRADRHQERRPAAAGQRRGLPAAGEQHAERHGKCRQHQRL